MNALSILRRPKLLAAALLLTAAGCQTATQPSTSTAQPIERPSDSPPTPSNVSVTPALMTFPTLRAIASKSGGPPQILILTAAAQTRDAARLTPRPPSAFWTTTPDLRPTTTPDFGDVPHQLTDVGVIFPRWPDDLGMVCYKVMPPPEGLFINNYWSQWDGPDETRVYVYAGATAHSTLEHRGSLMVAYKWDPCTWEEYMAPDPTRPLEISDARGHVLQIVSESRIYYFDIDSRLFLIAFPTSTPQVTPN